MESKLVTVEIMNNHPKLMRLPSVSRSLYFSIMPKSCYEMYERPVILTLNPKPNIKVSVPVLSNYRKERKKRTTSYEARPFIKPCPNSYVYSKMFDPKPKTPVAKFTLKKRQNQK